MLDNDMVNVKAVLRSITRDPPVAPEPDFFAKNYQFHETLYLLPKDKYQYKSANKEQMDRVKYLFKNATINGCVLPKLMTQYRAKQLYLGENV